MFTRILVPTDFSEPSDAALEYARVLAGKFGGTLHVLHVFDTLYVAGAMSPEVFIMESPAVQADLLDEARNRLRHRVTSDDRTRYAATTEIVSGTAAQKIVDYARDRRIDVIVMGTHGRSGLAHLLMGSVAEKVVRTASCPVMTVRAAPTARIPIPGQPPTESEWMQTDG